MRSQAPTSSLNVQPITCTQEMREDVEPNYRWVVSVSLHRNVRVKRIYEPGHDMSRVFAVHSLGS